MISLLPGIISRSDSNIALSIFFSGYVTKKKHTEVKIG